jgi:hypothetical protein
MQHSRSIEHLLRSQNQIIELLFMGIFFLPKNIEFEIFLMKYEFVTI